MRPISSQTLTFLKPDGKPYTGKVILRGGVYAGGEYCPSAGIRTSKDTMEQFIREDIALNLTDGKTTVWFDATQFISQSGWMNNFRYVFEYRFENTYQPGYIVINPLSNDPANATVYLQNVRGSAAAPQITKQEYQQYRDNKPTEYSRDVIDYTENIGISTDFNKSILSTDIVLPGETVGTDAKGYSTYAGENVVKFALYTTDDKKLTG